MPTGYTSIIDDNPDVTFADFVWRCARAFGALVTMRDEDIDAPIEEFTVAPYYEESVRKAEAALSVLRAMTVKDAAFAMRDEYEVGLAQRRTWRAEEQEKLGRYNAMREQVRDWAEPSAEHAGLKEFMLQQLETGAPSVDWCKDPEAPTGTAAEWLAGKIAAAEAALARAIQSLSEERTRVANRNRWVRELRESVPLPAKLQATEER